MSCEISMLKSDDSLLLFKFLESVTWITWMYRTWSGNDEARSVLKHWLVHAGGVTCHGIRVCGCTSLVTYFDRIVLLELECRILDMGCTGNVSWNSTLQNRLEQNKLMANQLRMSLLTDNTTEVSGIDHVPSWEIMCSCEVAVYSLPCLWVFHLAVSMRHLKNEMRRTTDSSTKYHREVYICLWVVV